MIDDQKLHQFMGQMLSDLGGAASIALVRIGDSLGLYKTLHARGAMTAAELAVEAAVNERYLREWLSHQAASNYLSYDPMTEKFELPPEQAMVFAIEDSPVYMTGAFACMASFLENQAKVLPAFKTGDGVAWGDQASCLFCAVAQFFRPGYHNNLVSQWLPALGSNSDGGGGQLSPFFASTHEPGKGKMAVPDLDLPSRDTVSRSPDQKDVSGLRNGAMSIEDPCQRDQLSAGDILAGQQAAIRTGKLVVNLNTRVVSVGDRQVHLTRKEYSILALLSLRKSTTLTKEIILDHLYGGMDEPEHKIIDVFICKLRKKLASANGGKHYIKTVWGRGYALLDPAPLPTATLPAGQDDPDKCHNAAGRGAGEERTLRQTHRPVPDQIEEADETKKFLFETSLAEHSNRNNGAPAPRSAMRGIAQTG